MPYRLLSSVVHLLSSHCPGGLSGLSPLEQEVVTIILEAVKVSHFKVCVGEYASLALLEWFWTVC